MRETTWALMRRLGLTTVFSNPGSTEVPFLAGLPDDLQFVLGLHEGTVVGMASGFAIGSNRPALVLLHSTPGLGNAVAALATARENRAPLVVIVGQQDRRHLAQQPFLAGHLRGLAGEYPVWTGEPARAQDVPGVFLRAYHEAEFGQGPALVIVPMDDWSAPAPAVHEVAGPARVLRGSAPDAGTVDALTQRLEAADAPVIVAGAGNASPAGWEALTALAEHLGCPVWQEAFGGAAGFPQDHPQFAGHLPSRRRRVREALTGRDLVLVVGTAALRQYPYDNGPLVAPETPILVITADPSEAHRSPAELAVIADPAVTCAAVLAQVRSGGARRFIPPAAPQRSPGLAAAEVAQTEAGPLRVDEVMAAIATRLPPDAILVEETPSSRPLLHARIPIVEPDGFVSAMGMLGFALPASIGLAMAHPDRPVVAVVGDGSTLYQVMALWSARRYGAGVVFIVLANGRYAIMDRLAEGHGGSAPWPSLEGVDVSGLARAQGVETVRVDDRTDLGPVLDRALGAAGSAMTPLLIEVRLEPDASFDP